MSYVVGIDIAKDKFDACLLTEDDATHYEIFGNSKRGINQFHRWLKKHGAKTGHICLEATGIYGDLVAETMYSRGYDVSIVNPARIKAYANSQMRRNKTDKLDAALIATYCDKESPPLWIPPSPELKELQALVRHRDDLKQDRQRTANRLEAQRSSDPVKRQLQQQINFIDQQIRETEQHIKDHINQFPDLKKQRNLLISIPGIGNITACVLLAEIGDIQRFDGVRQIVAYMGLNPRQHQSGRKSVSIGISRMGRSSLRAALYMPAIVAKQYNPVLKSFALRLEQQRGLAGKQIIVAVMRKLIHLVFGILKSGRAFDPNYGQQIQIAA